MENFFQGNLVRVQVTFTDITGVVTDPTVVTAKIENPSKVITTYVYLATADIVRVSTGVYYIEVDLNQGGIWFYRFEGTGALKAASQDSLKCVAETP
jgi:hypothetical protein